MDSSGGGAPEPRCPQNDTWMQASHTPAATGCSNCSKGCNITYLARSVERVTTQQSPGVRVAPNVPYPIQRCACRPERLSSMHWQLGTA